MLLGVAGYLKPPNLLMAAPLGLEPLLPAAAGLPGRASCADWQRRCERGLVLCATAASLYGVNAALTGEFNYQGGERKTFYGRFPFDANGTTFDTPASG